MSLHQFSWPNTVQSFWSIVAQHQFSLVTIVELVPVGW